MTHLRHLLILSFAVSSAAVAQTPSIGKDTNRPTFAAASTDSIYNYISSICLGWQSESKTKKSESQKTVLFRDKTGRYADAFLEAVEDLNRAFGYEKLLAQISTKEQTKDQAVVLFVGSKSEGRRFLRDSGGSSAWRGAWDGWFWWDASNELSKAAIAISLEDVTDHSIKYYFRQSLLTALGYPGYTRSLNSIFDNYEIRFRSQMDNSTHDPIATPFISDWDVAILRFCDRFLATDASRSNIRKVISREWPAFAAQLDKVPEIRQTAKGQ
jgi:hypothetical protein